MPISRSQRELPRYSRTKPRPMRCHTYVSLACISWASNSAMRFSKPCCWRFENGRLAGSAHTRSCATCAKAELESSARASIQPDLRKRKYIQHSSVGGVVRQLAGRIAESQRDGGIASVKSPGDDRSRPAANAAENGDVLLSVWSFIGNRLADNSRSCFEFPELLAAVSVGGFEPTIHRAEENYVARGDQCPTPDWEAIFDRPHSFSLNGIPCGEFSAITSRAWIHAHVGAYVRCAGNVVGAYVFLVLAEIVVRNVEQARTRREC